jgi:hypothetical protein
MCDVIIRDVLRDVAEYTDAAMRQRHRIGSAVRYVNSKTKEPLTSPEQRD